MQDFSDRKPLVEAPEVVQEVYLLSKKVERFRRSMKRNKNKDKYLFNLGMDFTLALQQMNMKAEENRNKLYVV